MKTIKTILLSALMILAFACKKEDHSTMPDMNMPSTTSASTPVNYSAAYVVNGESNAISIIDASTNMVKDSIKLGETSMSGMPMSTGIMWPHHISINPAKTIIAIGVPGMDLSAGHSGMSGMKGKIVLIDAVNKNILKIIDLPSSNHNSIFSPDGKEIWTSQMDSMGKVLIYDAANYSLKNSLNVGMMPAEVTFSSDGLHAFVANGESDNVMVISVASKTVVDTIPVGDNPVGAWMGSDNKMYVDNENGESITVINATNLSVEATIPLGFAPGMATFHSISKQLWVTDPSNGKVHIYENMGGWMEMGSVSTGAGAHAVVFHNDGKTAYVTNQIASTVSLITTADRTKIKDIAVRKKPNGIVLNNVVLIK